MNRKECIDDLKKGITEFLSSNPFQMIWNLRTELVESGKVGRIKTQYEDQDSSVS